MVFLPSLLLVGCGGGGDFNVGGGDGNLSGGGGGSSEGGGDSDDDSSSDASNITYLPLSVYVKNPAYVWDTDAGNVFITEFNYPMIEGILINPVNSSGLTSADNATVDDFDLTVDDIVIDPSESFPLLQKVIGSTVSMVTALVFDLTGSTSDVDLQELKNEAKSYILKAQANSNTTIKNQRFIIWSFGQNDPTVEDVVNLTGFTSDTAALESAIDGLVLNSNASSNLHKAIVKVIGGYVDDATTPPIDYANKIGDVNNNDLVDEITSDGVSLSQLVIFSSGSDTKREFSQTQMIESIQSQGLLRYESASSDTSNYFTSKPVFYYVLGRAERGNVYAALSDVSEKTTYLTLSNGSYSFSDSLILNQISAINSQIDLDNQYLYRYAFLPRQGSHPSVFKSKSNNFNYSLTGTIAVDLAAVGTPYYELESSVEITGPNGEYVSGAITGEMPGFSNGEYITGGQISLSIENTFKPVTRWTNESFQSSDYSWTLTGGSGTANPDGSYTVNSISGASATLRVDNTANSQMAFIIITN
tara:strand:+ start:5187 stop:6779 length:1593 start_codon:yes stop_codon:yes gene_type:complete